MTFRDGEDDPAVARLLRATASLRLELQGSDPPTAAELFSRAREVSARAPRRVALSWAHVAAAATIVLAAAGVGRLSHVPAPAQADGASGAEIVTGAAELVTVKLADGSVVRLAPSSRLRLGDRGAPRSVTLAGRAYFAIRRDPAHPFLVHTAAGTARVLGTRFELATTGGDLEITVVEGHVALDAAQNTVDVRGGQRTRIARGAAQIPHRLDDPVAALRWVGTFLTFQETPLAEAMRQVERAYGMRVVVADTVLARETVTATFTSQSGTEVIAVLCSVVSAHCRMVGDTTVVSR